MKQCPKCGGTGVIGVHIAYTNKPHYMGPAACTFCEGSGEVSEARLENYRRGRAIRDDRVERDVSLREEADRLGISVVELGQRERGIFDGVEPQLRPLHEEPEGDDSE